MRQSYLALGLLFFLVFCFDLQSQLPEKNPGPANRVSGASVSLHELSMPEAARNLYNSGRQKLSTKKNAAAALKDFQRAVAQAREFYEAYYQMGLAYLALGKLPEAQESFQKSLELSEGKYGSAEIALGTMLVDRGDLDSGERRIHHGLETASTFWMGHYYLGKVAFARGHFNEAEHWAEQARQYGPSIPIVYQLLIVIHQKQRNYRALLQDIDAYLSLDPHSSTAARTRELRAQVENELRPQLAKQ